MIQIMKQIKEAKELEKDPDFEFDEYVERTPSPKRKKDSKDPRKTKMKINFTSRVVSSQITSSP